MKVQLKPNEPVKFKGKRVVGTEDNPAFLVGDEETLRPLIERGLATEVKAEAATESKPKK